MEWRRRLRQNVKIAIIVVIKQRHATYHGFRLILVGCRAAVGHKSQTRALRDFLKNDRTGWRPSRNQACSEQN